LAYPWSSFPLYLASARLRPARLRRETTLSIKEIAARLNLGKPKGAKSNLHKYMSRHPDTSFSHERYPK
jgi:hypothetical protein